MQEAIDNDMVHFGPNEESVPCLKAYLRDRETQVPYSTFYQDGRAATKRLRTLMDADIFGHPKDEGVLQSLVEFASEKNDLILDFFAGSGTTAHAVIDLNVQDGGNRQFILVQLPERTDRADYPTIADITKERIRRAAAKIKHDHPTYRGDLGFKAYRLDHSHFKTWTDQTFTNPATLFDQLASAATPLIDGWQPHNLLVEILLLEGFPLDATVTPVATTNTVHKVTAPNLAHTLWVCLDETVHDATVAALPFADDDVFVCLDAALADAAKLTLSNRIQLRTI
jgi:adenine-specific DNA-methyltransferase